MIFQESNCKRILTKMDTESNSLQKYESVDKAGAICCQVCNLKFTNTIELKSHTFIHDGIQQLPNEMIENIMKFLPPDDLAAFSLTCKNYKDLAEQYFDRECNNLGQINIEADTTVHLGRFFNRNYEKRFCQFVRSVKLVIDNHEKLVEAFECIRMKCAKKLQSFEIKSQRRLIKLNEHQIDIISKQIDQLKVLALHGIMGGDVILNCIESLKVLIFHPYHTDLFSTNLNSWVNRTISSLEILILVDENYAQVNLNNFLRQNPQLIAVICDNLASIRSICSTEQIIPYAALWFHNEDDFWEVHDEIEQCCSRQNIKRLDIVLPDWGLLLPFLAILHFEYVKGLHFRVCHDIRLFFKHMDIRPNVEALYLHFDVRLTKRSLERITECFPNLYELSIQICNGTSYSIQNGLMLILSRLKKLKRLYLSGKDNPKYDAIELNTARLNLQDASFVTVNLSYSSYSHTPENFSKIRIQKGLRGIFGIEDFDQYPILDFLYTTPEIHCFSKNLNLH